MMLNDVLRGFVEGGKAAGVSAMVCDKGRETYFGSFGCANMESGAPFTRDTICCLYSMTKVVTAAAFLTLVDAGRVQLDQPLHDFCPEYRHMLRAQRDPRSDNVDFVSAKKPVTFRHLLTMTSGMPYDNDMANPVERAVHERLAPAAMRMVEAERSYDTAYTAAMLAREMARVPLLFEPGERWHYGLSLDVLGGFIEIITGMSLEQYMKAAIFDKLGMEETFFHMPASKRSRLARIYTLAGGSLAPWRNESPIPMVDGKRLCMGGGGLMGTIGDYARFASMLAMGGELDGVRVLSSRSVEQMRTGMLTAEQQPSFNWLEERGYTYGLGVRVMADPARSSYEESPGAFGWNGMAGTSVRIYPDTGRAALFFIQLVPAMHSKYLPEFVRAVNQIDIP